MLNSGKLKNHDPIITIIMALLSVISLLLIFSTTYNAQTAELGAGTFKKQILFFIVGFSIYFILSIFDISWLKNSKILFIIYFLTIAALIYVKFFTSEIANTNRWIVIFGFNIQPSEYAKITLVIITAAILGLKQESMGQFVHWNKKIRAYKNPALRTFLRLTKQIHKSIEKQFPQFDKFVLSGLITLPVIALIFIQPSLGNTVIILAIWMGVIFAATSAQLIFLNFLIPIILLPLVSWEVIGLNSFMKTLNLDFEINGLHIASVFLIFLITLGISFFTKLKWYFVIFAILIGISIRPAILQVWDSSLISPYQKTRIETFFESPENDPLDAGYQVKQSKIAIGSGQLNGRGYLKGTQSTLNVLPFAHTDFIFASLGEQFGLIGGILLLCLYFILLMRLVVSATSTSDEFGFLIIIGITTMMLLNIFISIGMNMGKLPVTGIPLPLVSYGGSSVLVNMIGLGLVQSIRSNRKLSDIAESFTPGANSLWTGT